MSKKRGQTAKNVVVVVRKMAEGKDFMSLLDQEMVESGPEGKKITSLEAIAAMVEEQVSLTRSVRELQAGQGHQIEQLIRNFGKRLDEAGARIDFVERSLDSGMAAVQEEIRSNYERAQIGTVPTAMEIRISELEARLRRVEEAVEIGHLTEERMASVHATLLASAHRDLKKELFEEIGGELDKRIREIKVEISERETSTYNESTPLREGIGTIRHKRPSLSESTTVHEGEERGRQGRPVPKPRSMGSIYGGLETLPNEPQVTLNRRPVQKPMPYDGTTTWDAYFAQFQIIADVNNWSDKEKAAFLASSLKGQALAVLGGLRQEDRHNFGQLVSALANRFGNAHQTELARVRFKNRMKRRDESLPELSQEIERLSRLSYPDAPSSVQDVLARDQFIDALVEDETRLRIKHERPKTLQEALSLALEFESFQLASRQHRSKYAVRGLTATSRGNHEEDEESVEETNKASTKGRSPSMERIRRDNEQLMRVATRLEKSMQECLKGIQMAVGMQRKTRKGCWHCEAKDHIRKDCPLLKENGPDRRAPASPLSSQGQGNES